MNAAIYARVSTADQTCENQLLELRRYADARGWAVTLLRPKHLHHDVATQEYLWASFVQLGFIGGDVRGARKHVHAPGQDGDSCPSDPHVLAPNGEVCTLLLNNDGFSVKHTYLR